MQKKRFSNPKLFIPRVNGKPTLASGRPWYISFYWRTDPDGPLDKKYTYNKGVNRHKTVKERRAAGKALADGYKVALERGWNPEKKMVDKTKETLTVEMAFDHAFELKAANAKESTVDDYRRRLNVFKKWAAENSCLALPIQKFTLDIFYKYYDYLILDYSGKNGKLTNTSIDNYKRVISSLMTVLKNKRIIDHNFVKDIPRLETKPVQNTPFTPSQIADIVEYLEENDPYMLEFIRFMVYCYLRPREILRLQIRDMNVVDFILSVETKTEALAHVKIVEKIKPVIARMKIENYEKTDYLFTTFEKPGEWPSKLSTKVGYMSKRFAKVKKALGFGREYGLYSFRHSAIANLQENLAKLGFSEHAIIHEIMPITRHRSEKSVRAYLRNLKKYTPKDRGDLNTLEI